MKKYFIEPKLYHRINPVVEGVQKPALATTYFFVSFILYMIPLLIWHYGMELFFNINSLKPTF